MGIGRVSVGKIQPWHPTQSPPQKKAGSKLFPPLLGVGNGVGQAEWTLFIILKQSFVGVEESQGGRNLEAISLGKQYFGISDIIKIFSKT